MMTDQERERLRQLEARVAELERFIEALKRLQGPNGTVLQVSGTNARLQ